MLWAIIEFALAVVWIVLVTNLAIVFISFPLWVFLSRINQEASPTPIQHSRMRYEALKEE